MGRADPPTPADETRERILAAAARLFGEQGYARSTTRALAAAAGVNEVTLFRHFGSKEKLFAAVLDRHAAPAIVADLRDRLTGDYRTDLTLIGGVIMRVLLERADGLRLMLCEASHFPEAQELLVQNPRQLRAMVADYLRRGIEAGVVRPLDPEAAGQAFLGMFFSYAISQAALGDRPAAHLSQDELVAQFVDIFVAGTVAADGG